MYRSLFEISVPRNCANCKLSSNPSENICDGAAEIALHFLNLHGMLMQTGETSKEVIERYLW